MSSHSRNVALLLVIFVVLPECSRTDPGGTGEIRVSLAKFSIQASVQSFTPGVPYRLLITNRGQVNHELRIGPPSMQGGPGEVTFVDEMTLQPGTAHTIDVVFPEAAGSAALEFACHLPAHYELGMHRPITVH